MARLSQNSSITNISKNIFNIREKSSETKKNIESISKIIRDGTKERSRIEKRTLLLESRRKEQSERAVRESVLEAKNVRTSSIIPGSKVLSTAGGNFIERILGFIGWVSVGWLINNLPMINDLGEKFMGRVNKIHEILKEMPNKIFIAFGDFGRVLTAYKENFSNFDFLDMSGKVKAATDELTKSFNDIQEDLKETFSILIGQRDDEIQNESQGEEPSTGGGSTYTSTGGEKLDPANRDYGEYRPGASGTRGKSRVHGKGGERGHTGEDFPLPEGTPITLVSNGTVVDVGIMGDSRDPDGTNGGYGNFVVIQLEDGTFVKLAHMKSISVKKGDKVGAGTGSDGNAKVVGFSGSTGLSTGPHLHLDHATGYNPASASVSGTMDPMGLVDAGLIVKGGNVKATKSTQTTSNTNNTNNTTNIRTSYTRPQTPVLPSSGKYNLAQLIQLAKSAGFNDDESIKMAAIAMAESGGDPTNDTIKSGLYKRSGETSYGLWQINMTGALKQERFGWFGINSVDQLYDPITNAKAAKIIYDKQGFDAWSVYGGKRYNDSLKEAKKLSPNIVSNKNLNTSQTIASAAEEEGNQNIFLVANNGTGNQSISAPIQSSTETTISYTDPSYMLNTFTKNRILLALNYV